MADLDQGVGAVLAGGAVIPGVGLAQGVRRRADHGGVGDPQPAWSGLTTVVSRCPRVSNWRPDSGAAAPDNGAAAARRTFIVRDPRTGEVTELPASRDAYQTTTAETRQPIDIRDRIPDRPTEPNSGPSRASFGKGKVGAFRRDLYITLRVFCIIFKC